MSENKTTKFEATLNPFEIKKMREQANNIAEKEGLKTLKELHQKAAGSYS